VILASVTKTKTKTKTKTTPTTTKKKTTMTMTTTRKMMLLLFVFFFLFAGANAPNHNDELLGAVFDSLEDLLQKLERIAGNVQPPLPTPLMAAAILFVFCTTPPARLAAGWGCLARWARSNDSRALAPSRCRWILEGLSVVVVRVDGVLSPFKLEDWRRRALDAETALAASKAEAAAAKADAIAARAETADAKEEATNAQARLQRVNVNSQRMKVILDKAQSELESRRKT
jgi:hypothetical protein